MLSCQIRSLSTLPHTCCYGMRHLDRRLAWEGGREGGGGGREGGREGGGKEGREGRDDCYTYSNRYVQ